LAVWGINKDFAAVDFRFFFLELFFGLRHGRFDAQGYVALFLPSHLAGRVLVHVGAGVHGCPSALA
jgi:hypothetical protein